MNIVKSVVLCVVLILAVAYEGIGSSVVIVPQAKKDEAYFAHIPESFTSNPSYFASFWSRAPTEALRIAVFGDSQETAPGGSGAIYIPRLNYEMYLRFGPVSETMVSTNGGFGGGVPYGSWLLAGGDCAARAIRFTCRSLKPLTWIQFTRAFN